MQCSRDRCLWQWLGFESPWQWQAWGIFLIFFERKNISKAESLRFASFGGLAFAKTLKLPPHAHPVHRLVFASSQIWRRRSVSHLVPLESTWSCRKEVLGQIGYVLGTPFEIKFVFRFVSIALQWFLQLKVRSPQNITDVFLYIYTGVSKNNGTPQIIHFNRVWYYKPSILGYHHLRKHPCISVFWGILFSWTFRCWTFTAVSSGASTPMPSSRSRVAWRGDLWDVLTVDGSELRGFTSWYGKHIPLFTGYYHHPRWLFGISEPWTVWLCYAVGCAVWYCMICYSLVSWGIFLWQFCRFGDAAVVLQLHRIA